jgi:UDP-N-acetylmuramoyl-tripeptide--D-alanyl-D-alanine ligase
MRFDEHLIKEAIPGVSLRYAAFPATAEFSIDSRTIKPGEVFVALQGSHVDGHNFVADAVTQGAAGLIIAQDKQDCLRQCNQDLLTKIAVVIVPDPKAALINLAAAWRARFTCPIIGVTGSVGKTSTRQMLNAIFELHGMKVCVSSGNQNTTIGIALTLLGLRDFHQAAIIEMGISRRGEMANLVAVARPTMGIITGIGHSHMEGLGSLADIALEKRDIFKYFKEDNIGVINGDQPILSHVSYAHPVVKFGAKTTNQVQARKINVGSNSIHFIMKLYNNKYPITLSTNHTGAVFNSLAAAAAAYLCGIPVDIIIRGIQIPVVVAGRFEEKPMVHGKGFIINDCYNASPESMKAALLAFQKLAAPGKKIAVLGDMLELGENSPFWHRQLGRFLKKAPSVRSVVLVGSQVAWTKKTAPHGVAVHIVPSWQEATEIVRSLAQEEDAAILVKGSRGMRLDNLVHAFTQQ